MQREVPLTLTVVIKRPRRETDHSPPSNGAVKNMWSYTSTPPQIFMTQSLFKHKTTANLTQPKATDAVPPNMTQPLLRKKKLDIRLPFRLVSVRTVSTILTDFHEIWYERYPLESVLTSCSSISYSQ
jgi:hypothetical protein